MRATIWKVSFRDMSPLTLKDGTCVESDGQMFETLRDDLTALDEELHKQLDDSYAVKTVERLGTVERADSTGQGK